MATSQLNCDKIQITGFRKTRGNRAGNIRTDSSNKINKSELKLYSNDGKRHAKPSCSKLIHKRDASISPHTNLTK